MSLHEKAADADIAEFQSLREELFARIESQRQAFNYLIVLSTAVLAAVASAFEKAIPLFDLQLILFIPLIAAPLAFIFFDNELVIWAIGSYIRNTLSPRLSANVGMPVLTLETERGKYLAGRKWWLHLGLSVGRWLLFLLPVGLPVWYSLKHHSAAEWDYVPSYGTVVVLDLIVLLLLLCAIVTAIAMRFKGWRQ